MSRILVIHGPNLNLLGERKVSVYGKTSLEAINRELKALGKKKKVAIESFQSNHEGEIVDKIQKAKGKFSAIIINPAAYTHTSVAIRDAIEASKVPAIEVHLSNIYAREKFRHHSLIAGVCVGQIAGFGKRSYTLALEVALEKFA